MKNFCLTMHDGGAMYPNTDAARLRSLEVALVKSERISPQDLAFNQVTLMKLKKVIILFKQGLDTHQKTYIKRVNANKEYQKAFKKSKLYLSHFIQVFNFSILRNEIPKMDRKLYNIHVNDSKVPEMNTETELVEWGTKILEGEKQRLAKGGNPIYNPKIAVVRLEFEKFLKHYNSQNTFKHSHEFSIEKLIELRKNVDNVILDIWNQVEAFFSAYSDTEKRERAESYGVKYVLRKKEKLMREFNG